MTQLETAFQTYDPSDKPYQSELRFRKPIYLARHNPYMLARAIMDAGRQVLPHSTDPLAVCQLYRVASCAICWVRSKSSMFESSALLSLIHI